MRPGELNMRRMRSRRSRRRTRRKGECGQFYLYTCGNVSLCVTCCSTPPTPFPKRCVCACDGTWSRGCVDRSVPATGRLVQSSQRCRSKTIKTSQDCRCCPCITALCLKYILKFAEAGDARIDPQRDASWSGAGPINDQMSHLTFSHSYLSISP